MKYRRFGKTEWQVSEIGLGGAWFYGRPEEGALPPDHGIGVVHRALELGVNYFDTAPLYGRGRSEEIMGLALRDVDQPHFLATKVGYYPEPFDYTRDTVWRGFEASLKRLGRDRVDLLQIHESEIAGWDRIFGPGMTLLALEEIQAQGLTTHIGITGADLDLMARAVATGAFASVITYLRYDMLVTDALDQLAPAAAEHDVALILASPLHAGLLGSKRDDWIRAGRFADLYERLDALESMLADHPSPIEEVGLRFLLDDPGVGTVLTGVRDIPELERSCATSEACPLDAELRARILSLSRSGKGVPL